MSNDNFAEYRKKLVALGADLDSSAMRVVSKVANVGMKVTVKNTPVNKDPKVIGGTLKKAWLKTKPYKLGNEFVSGYTNNIHYGVYVNNGHRTVSKSVTTGYVKGVRMLEQGMNEARRNTNSIFEQEITRVKRKTGF